MRLSFLGLCLALTLPSWSWRTTLAQDDKAKPDRVMVAIDVLIADVVGEKDDADRSDKAVIERIQSLEKQNKLSRQTRVRLATLNEQQASVQFGERAPLAVARTVRGGGGFAGAAPGGGGGPPEQTSFTYQNMGTLVHLTPRVEKEGIALDCKVELSRLAPRKPTPTDKPEGSFEPASIETITANSTVQGRSGEAVLLSSQQTNVGGETRRTYILVTATLAGDR
jgi:hypothetical protein